MNEECSHLVIRYLMKMFKEDIISIRIDKVVKTHVCYVGGTLEKNETKQYLFCEINCRKYSHKIRESDAYLELSRIFQITINKSSLYQEILNNNVTGNCIQIEKDYYSISANKKNSFINECVNLLTNNELERYESRLSYRDMLWKTSIYLHACEMHKCKKNFYIYSVIETPMNNLSYGESYTNVNFEELKRFKPMITKIWFIVNRLSTALSVKAGVYNIVLDNAAAALFFHETIGHLLEADDYSWYAKKYIALSKKGMFNKELTLYDDPTLPGLLGSNTFDDEGILTQRTCIVKNGEVKNLLHSNRTAALHKRKFGGNSFRSDPEKKEMVRMTNTYVENGSFSKEELFHKANNGLYLCGMKYGQTKKNKITLVPQFGFTIKDNKPADIVNGIEVSGDIIDMVKKVTLIGNDTQWSDEGTLCIKKNEGLLLAVGSPHIYLENVRISIVGSMK